MAATVLDDCEVKIDLNKPRWDQSTFLGRLKHFSAITDMRKLIASNKDLDEAKQLITLYRLGMCPSGTKEEQLWQAKQLYDSAFHPDSGERMNFFGRMSCQVPGGLAVTGLMLQFFRSPLEVAVTQWVNQSFNACVNYTNRNAAASLTTKQMLFAYVSATSTALGVAVGLNLWSRSAAPIVARCVPFFAVASANAVNIPLTRQSELIDGVLVTSDNGKAIGKSQKCARKGITQVVVSRIVMAAPGMIMLPVIMEKMQKRSWFMSKTWLHLPFQCLGVGIFLTFMVPVACALFPQKASMKVGDLEVELQDTIHKLNKEGEKNITRVYFNKGL